MSKDLDKEDILYKKRHSIAHVMAEAVLDLFPNTKIAIGPPIKDGFYYDFEFKKQITEDSLLDIENRMREILKTGSSFEKEIISVEQALEIFKDEPYKIDLIKNFDLQNEVSIYKSHNFVDLCRGPHVENMNKIDPKAFKLTSIAGAYWRGSEKNPMLTRIYGTLWNNEKELRSYLNLREEIKKEIIESLEKSLIYFLFMKRLGQDLFFFIPMVPK